MNVVAMPNRGYAPDAKSLASELRSLADRIEDGSEDSAKLVVVSESSDGTVSQFCYGGPTTIAHCAGLLAAAQLKVLT